MLLQTIALAFAVLLLMVIAMAVGVIFSNRELKGSCGGTGRACTCTEKARRDCALADGPRD